MAKADLMLEALDARVKRRDERRRFFKLSGGFAVGAAGGAVLSACGSSAGNAVAQNPPTPPAAANIDGDILNFALQLEYLEAQFYSLPPSASACPTAR